MDAERSDLLVREIVDRSSGRVRDTMGFKRRVVGEHRTRRDLAGDQQRARHLVSKHPDVGHVQPMSNSSSLLAPYGVAKVVVASAWTDGGIDLGLELLTREDRVGLEESQRR